LVSSSWIWVDCIAALKTSFASHSSRERPLCRHPEFAIKLPVFQLELLEFDCSHGFNIGPQSQYRWYQVLYQVGVFVSRSSSDVIALPGEVLPLLALLQVLNATVLYFEAINRFMSHILLLMCVIVYEGLLGGASYVNTFRVIHEEH
ncbi:CLN3 protein, partial [Ancylostoma duodenale]